jgi:hypothetical protein
VDDIIEAGLTVKLIAADYRKRTFIRNTKSGGYMSCDFCLIPGTSHKSSDGTTKVVFPFAEEPAPLRTDENIRAAMVDAEEGRRTGILGWTPLADIPGLDLSRDVPVDGMHQFFLGVTRRLVELTYDIRTSGKRREGALQYNQEYYDRDIVRVKIPSEMERRTRMLDFPNYKASEWRGVALFYFPIVLEQLQASSKERETWALFCYIMRAFHLSEQDFPGCRASALPLVREFQRKFQACFGLTNMLYNLHSVCHIEGAASHGDLCTSSTFMFEGAYASFKNKFVAGTTSTGKQMIQNQLLHLASGHSCPKKLRFHKLQPTSNTDDGLVYTKHGQWYRLLSPLPNDSFLANRVDVEPFATPDVHPHLDWSLVGTWKVLGRVREAESVNEGDIIGKGIVSAEKVLCLATPNVLFDK